MPSRLRRLRHLFRRQRLLKDPTDLDAVIGIDFGTSSTRAGARLGGRPPFPLPLGRSLNYLPTTVGFDPERGLAVGERTAALPPDQVISSVKSAITLGESTVRVSDGQGHHNDVDADMVIELLLRQVVDRIKAREPALWSASRVVMACPAIWDDEQRSRLAAIARLAGIDVEGADLIDEPTAAGAALFHLRRGAGLEPPNGRILLVDSGGGTLDVAVLEVERTARGAELQTVAVHGSNQAGDAMDACIAETLRLKRPQSSSAVLQRHRAAATDALLIRAGRELKEELTTASEASRPVFGTSSEVSMTRPELDMAIAPVLQSMERVVGDVLLAAAGEDLGGDWSHLAAEVKHVQLAGGATRVKVVEAELKRCFPGANVGPDPLLGAPEEAVVAGLTYC